MTVSEEKRRVLIVDNDEAILEVFKLMLSDYDVAVAMDGKEGIEVFKRFRPHIVLVNLLVPKSAEEVGIDLPLPEMDGVEFTKEVLKIDPEAKVIGVTAFASYRGKEVLEAGALEVLEKPLKKDELLEVIERHIG